MYRCLAIHLHQAASDPPSPEDSNQQASHVVFFGTFFQCQGCEIPMIHVFITWFFGDLARGALNFQNKSFELVWFYRVSPHLVPLLQQPTAASQEPKESARIEAAKEAEKGIYAGLENLWQKFFFSTGAIRITSEVGYFFQRGASRCVTDVFFTFDAALPGSPPLCVNRLRQVSHTVPCDQKTILWYCAYIVNIS